MEIVLAIAFIAIIFVSFWKVFTKAGEPGWAGFVPIYNYMVLARIAGKPEWWGLLILIPCVGIIFGIIIMIEVAKNFGKSAGFGIGLALLGFIFFPILAFSDAQYIGPATGGGRSRRRFDDEDDYDDRGRGRGRDRDDDDDDDRPRGRGRARDDDDDDDDRPRRR